MEAKALRREPDYREMRQIVVEEMQLRQQPITFDNLNLCEMNYGEHSASIQFKCSLFARFPTSTGGLKGWRMVLRKSWVSENFIPVSESRQLFYRVSEARCFLVWFRNRFSLGIGFSNKGLGESRIQYHSPPLFKIIKTCGDFSDSEKPNDLAMKFEINVSRITCWSSSPVCLVLI